MTDRQLIDEGYIDGKKSFEWHLERIIEGFNFENVHKAMIATEWYWKLGEDKRGNERMGIPSLYTIQNKAYDLLEQAYESGNSIPYGGFMAGWDSGEMFLIFTIEETSA